MRVMALPVPRFQPTLPARGATRRSIVQRGINDISTHAPRTGSDAGEGLPIDQHGGHFNPRSPHGERQGAWHQYVRCEPISTHAPRTGSDKIAMYCRDMTGISTHAPRTGSDPSYSDVFGEEKHISTHAPRTGSDATDAATLGALLNFNPRSPHGERPALYDAVQP